MRKPRYQHTQIAWPIRLALFAAAITFAVAGAVLPPAAGLRTDGSTQIVFIGGGALTALLGWILGSLSVCVDAKALQLWFGPGWPRRTIMLADVAGATPTRTRFRDGWGVHRTRRGWLYNVSGCDAVEVVFKSGPSRSSILIGTDEPRRLAAAIRRAAAQADPRAGT